MIVGAEKKHFIVDKAALCYHSLWFYGALYGPFLESRNGQVELLEDDPTAFRIFLRWLHFGNLDELLSGACFLDVKWTDWIRVFDMAKRFLVDDLKEAAYTMVYDYIMITSLNADVNSFHRVFSTAKSSELRFLLVSAILYEDWDKPVKWLGDLLDADHEFARDVGLCTTFIMQQLNGQNSPMDLWKFLTDGVTADSFSERVSDIERRRRPVPRKTSPGKKQKYTELA